MSKKQKNSYQWMILAISFLLMFIFSISLQALPPIFENIMQDIPFSHSQAGLLMSAYSILGIFIPFAVASFLNRFGLKEMLISGLVAVIIALVGFALSSSYSLLLFFRLLSGAGATILAVLAPLLITKYFDQKKMGIAMGIFNTAVPLGMVVAANLFGYLGLFMNWKTIIAGIAVLALAALTMVFYFLDLPSNQRNDESASSRLEFNLGSSLWILAVIWMIANGQLVAYTTFGPQYFQLSGMTTQKAGLLVSQIMFVSIFLAPVIGIVIDKINQKKPFLLIGSVIMGISFLLLATSWLSLSFWAVTLGVGFSLIPVCVFSLLPDVVKPKQASMGLAVITAAANLGITLGPLGLGSLLDMTSGNFSAGFSLLSVFSLISVVVTLRIQIKAVSDDT